MRPDARAAATHTADFFNQHPKMSVRIEGFADERGSVRGRAARTGQLPVARSVGRTGAPQGEA